MKTCIFITSSLTRSQNWPELKNKGFKNKPLEHVNLLKCFLCCKQQHTLHAPKWFSTQFTKTHFLAFIFILLFKCLQHFHLVTLYHVSLLQENDFSSFKWINAGSLSSVEVILEVSFICISQRLSWRGALPAGTGTAGSACYGQHTLWLISAAHHQLTWWFLKLLASSVSVYPYQTKKMMCYSLVTVTRWWSHYHVPSPIPRCPEERCWAPCPWKGWTQHTAVLVSSYYCRQKTQQLETVNSLSIIILHITRGWLA